MRILASLLVAACLLGGAAAPDAAIDPARLSEHVRILASDAFEGRGPGTAGEQRTLEYLVEAFRSLGLRPGGEDGGWFQTVSVDRFALKGEPTLAIRVGGRDWPVIYMEDAVVGPSRAAAGTVKDAPMVFVGYGVHAPERGWDDYKGVDLRGRIAVVLDRDPDDRASEAGLFGGKALSWDGDFATKYAELTRRGAAGMLVLHAPGVTGFDWAALKDFWAGPQLDIVRPNAELAGAPITGWLREEPARWLFAAAGLDLPVLEQAAMRPDFKPVVLSGVTLSAAFEVERRQVTSRNLIAVLPGAGHPDEAFLYFGHWDHLGRGPAQADGDDIYNGALDNASGLAGLLELARVFAAGPRPQRSVVFIAFTLEESGLLGSAYYAANPVWPLAKTVGGINIDGLPKIAPSEVRVAFGGSDLDDLLTAAAQRQGRTVRPQRPERLGAWAASDHYPLARAGVPVLFAGGRVAEPAYFERQYHQADDEWSADWDWDSAALEVELYRAVGLSLVNSRDWPAWKPDSPFKRR